MKKLTVFILALALANPFLNIQAKDFTSVDVIDTAHSFECLDYEIILPICVYMLVICTPFGCYVRLYYRDRIRHKLPDMVVTAFRQPGKTPFTEIRNTESQVAMQVFNSSAIRSAFNNIGMDGSNHENTLVNRHAAKTVKNNRYNETNVIGSPAPAVIRETMKYGVPRVLGAQYICKSNVTRYRPYFMSEVDAIAWRKAELNPHPSIFVKGAREIGSLTPSNLTGNTWGKVHPRVGFVIQTDPAKAAAVASQRAIDIVTQKNQVPHVYQSYGTSPGEVLYIPATADESSCEGGGFGQYERDPNCVVQYNGGFFDPEPDEDGNSIRPTLNESCPLECYGAGNSATQMPASNEKDKAWQMIVPVKSDSCEAFGSSDPDWSNDKNNDEGEFGHNYWREYECCKPAPGVLLNP